MDKVLVTGMSGLIGSLVRERLEGKYELHALNRRDVPGVPTHTAEFLKKPFVVAELVQRVRGLLEGSENLLP